MYLYANVLILIKYDITEQIDNDHNLMFIYYKWFYLKIMVGKKFNIGTAKNTEKNMQIHGLKSHS